jgi:hypothetical protein
VFLYPVWINIQYGLVCGQALIVGVHLNLWKESIFKLIGGDIYFHEFQKEPSILGGKIIGFHIREESNKVVFRFKELESHRGLVTPIEGWGNEQKRVWS